jgi:outer membrane protein TolC
MAVSNWELRGITESLLAATETAYWDYVLAGQKIAIVERSLAIARQQLDEIEQRIEVGTLAPIEAAAAHAEVAGHEQALIDVHSTLEESRLRLLRLINPASKRPFDLQIKAISAAEINPVPITDLPDRLLLAAQSRPDLNEARLRLKQNRLEIIVTRNGLLPRLDLFINLGKTGYADSFSAAFRDLDKNNHEISAGITLSHYLNNRQATALDRAARASRRQAADSVENLKQLVELDVRLAVNEFERARKQIRASRATRLLREETLRAEKERFDVGVSTTLLVAQAQRELLLSAIDEAEAIINCRKALINLYRAEGSLLDRRGIRVASPSMGP